MPENSLQLLLPFITAGVGVLGAILTYHLVGKRRLTLAHRLGIIREHTTAVHRYGEQYYLPLIIFSRAVERSLRQTQNPKTGTDSDVSLWRLAQWLYMRHKWLKDVGSIIILRDPTGEKLVAHFLSGFSKFFGGGPMGTAERHTLANVLESDSQTREFFNRFKDKLDEKPLKAILEKYKEWLRKKEEISSLAAELRCFHTLFMFEINMCYESWYRKKTVKPDVDFNLVREKLNELRASGGINLKDAKKYLKKLGASKREIQKLPFFLRKE